MTLLTLLNQTQQPGEAHKPPVEAVGDAGPPPSAPVNSAQDGLLATEDGKPLGTESGKAILLEAGAGQYNVTGGNAGFIVRGAPATMILSAVRTNQTALRLSAISLLALLDAKIEQLREARSNSEDAAQYEDLKRRVEEFLAASASAADEPIVSTTLSIADGLRAWWTKDHAGICNKAFNIGLFAGGLSLCAAAGALGPASIITVGTLIAGKDIPAALEACVKLLKGD